MKRVHYFSAGMILVSYIISAIILYFLSSESVMKDRQQNYLLAAHIYDTVHEEVFRPIIVSRTMSIDTFLHEKLIHEEEYSEQEIESIMAEYLKKLRTEMHYSSAFVVSDKTKRYYTATGIEKLIDPQASPYDIWYQIFLESRKPYDLDTDRDESNDYRWTVFINYRITDYDGRLLGVCGIGVVMSNLQSIFDDFERMYRVKINLIDPDGLVQVDTHTQDIENAYISEAIMDKAGVEQFSYSQRGMNGYRMTRYMKDLEWYLVIQGLNSRTMNTTFGFLILFISCIIVLGLYFGIIRMYSSEYTKKVSADRLEDPVTGLPNRNYLREAYGEKGVFNTTRYKAIAVFDIDGFKNAKEDNEGDELLRNVVVLANEYFAWKGMLVRWGDDDFVVLLEMSAEDASVKFTDFCKTVKSHLGYTVSVGISPIDLSDTIKVNYYRAVQKCYAKKEEGGNGVYKN